MMWLEKMRQKSNTEKKIFAFNAALLITIFIFVTWAFTLFHSLDDLTFKIDDDKKETFTPLQSLTASVKGIFSGDKVEYKAE